MVYHGVHFMGMGCSWFLGAFVIIIVVILVIVGINRRTGAEQYKTDNAMEILRERYARGEISKEEFEERKKTLT